VVVVDSMLVVGFVECMVVMDSMDSMVLVVVVVDGRYQLVIFLEDIGR